MMLNMLLGKQIPFIAKPKTLHSFLQPLQASATIFFVGIFQSGKVNGGGREEPCQHTRAAEERSVPTTADQV
jgi:hypothetical protein